VTFSESVATVRTTDNFEITINPNELIGRHIYLTGEFDRSIVEILLDFAEPNDILLDIGANIGYVSACLLNKVPGCRSIAVEPQAEVLKFLERNLPTDRATIYPYALSDRDGEVFFTTNANNSGQGHIVDHSGPGTFTVQSRSAETMCRDLGIDRLDLVKIDTEGFERIIVAALLDTLSRLQPKIIVFENAAHEGKEISTMLSAIGYKVYGIQKTLTSLSLSQANLSTGDCVAVSDRRPLPTTVSKYKRIAA
jgi:FkbM family methyltransferase